MHTHVHSQGDEEEDRYSAQQRGARPHDQYDKADRSSLERTGTGGFEVENRWKPRITSGEEGLVIGGVLHLLSHPTSVYNSTFSIGCRKSAK